MLVGNSGLLEDEIDIAMELRGETEFTLKNSRNRGTEIHANIHAVPALDPSEDFPYRFCILSYCEWLIREPGLFNDHSHKVLGLAQYESLGNASLQQETDSECERVVR